MCILLVSPSGKKKSTMLFADGATPGKAPGRNLDCDGKVYSLSGFTCTQLDCRRNRVFPGKAALIKRDKQSSVGGISLKWWLLKCVRKLFLYV